MLWFLACQPSVEDSPKKPEESGEVASGPQPLSEWQPRSVLILNVDTLRADRLHAYGHDRDTMPFFQERKGQVAFSGWATSGWTPTSVPSLLTGQEVHGHGVVGVEGLEYQVVEGEMLQQWLGEQGFRTAFFSSNHVLPNTSVIEGWEQYQLVDDLYSSQALSQAALGWLEALGEEDRFFLMLQPMDTHHPWMPPSEYRGIYADYSTLPFPITSDTDTQTQALWDSYRSADTTEREEIRQALLSVYDEEILALDASIEQLLVGMEERGLLKETLVLLTADHGESLYDAPDQLLHGGTLRQEIVSIPLLFYSPSILEEVPAEGCLASSLDVWPTLAARLDLAPPGDLPGIDLMTSCRSQVRAELFERPPGSEYQLTDVVAISSASRLEHACDRGERKSYLLESDPYGNRPTDGTLPETTALAPVLDEAIDAVLRRWPEQRCLGR